MHIVIFLFQQSGFYNHNKYCTILVMLTYHHKYFIKLKFILNYLFFAKKWVQNSIFLNLLCIITKIHTLCFLPTYYRENIRKVFINRISVCVVSSHLPKKSLKSSATFLLLVLLPEYNTNIC